MNIEQGIPSVFVKLYEHLECSGGVKEIKQIVISTVVD